MQKQILLFVAPYFSSFIKNDLTILTKEFDIIIDKHDWSKKYLTPFYFIVQFFTILFKIHKIDKIVIQFGAYWAFVPSLLGKIFRKPVYIILHGTDCASIPEINYGSLRKNPLKLLCNLSYRLATKLLPVSNSLINVENNYSETRPNQGVKSHFPNLKTPYQTINNGLNINFWESNKTIKKQKNTFYAVISEGQYILKGGDLILQLAERMKDYNFNIIGSLQPHFIKTKPENLKFLGKLPQEKLKEHFLSSQFYFQLSIYEGFGLSLCEAMLCECIPIGSSVNHIPEIIGNTGFVLAKKDIDMLEELTKEAIASSNKTEMGKAAKQRILDNYKLEKREKELLKLLKKS